MRPPRALVVPFELGRPLGAPADPAFQRDVLEHLFALLRRTGPVVTEYYEKDAPATSAVDTQWSCPVNFPAVAAADATLEQLLREVRLLQPWFARAAARRGYTSTGTSGLDMEAVCRFLDAFRGSLPMEDTGDGLLLGDRFKLAADDLKLFYLEAAMEQPNPGSSAVLQDWFWDQTAAGALLLELRTRCQEHPDPLVKNHARFTLVPSARGSAAPRT